MDKAARARQRVLAIFLPITALLYVSAEALNPKGTDAVVSDRATAVKVLPIAAAHSAQLYLSGSLTLLARGSGRLLSGHRHSGQGPRLGGRYGRGAPRRCGCLLRNRCQRACRCRPRRRGGGTSHPRHGGTLPRDGLQLHVQQVFTDVYFISEYAAQPIMAFALWRSRSVTRWLAVLFFAAMIVAEVMPSIGPIVLLYTLPFVVAMVLLAVHIWKGTAPAASQRQEPAAVPVQQ